MNIKSSVEVDCNNIWIGLQWKLKCILKEFFILDVWICFIPCIAIHLTFTWGNQPRLRNKNSSSSSTDTFAGTEIFV